MAKFTPPPRDNWSEMMWVGKGAGLPWLIIAAIGGAIAVGVWLFG